MSDVVVIGAGLVGASVARALGELGADVEVLEARRPAGGTSLATFAWVNPAGKRPRAYFELNARGVVEHRRLAAELGGEWFHPGGNLEWSPDANVVRTKQKATAEWGYPARWLDRREAAELEPDAAFGDGDAFVHYPDDGWVDPGLLVRRLLDHPRVGVLTGSEVVRIELEVDRVTGVELADGGRVPTDACVIATGPDASQLLAPVGFELPMRHSPGILALTEPVAAAVGRVLHPPGVAIRPDGAGRLMLASDELDRHSEPAGGEMSVNAVADELLARATRAIPRLAGARIEAVRVGRRALTGDGMPAVGPVPGIAGAYLAVTHSGVTLAPLLGRLAAPEILGGDRAAELDDYRPSRFIES